VAGFNIFQDPAFGMMELSTAVNANPYKPGFLGSLGLFSVRSIPTTAAAIEIKEGVLNMIQTTPRGAPIVEGSTEKRDIFYQETVRIAKGHTINSAEIQNVRAFGTTSELMSMMRLVGDRLNGPTGLVAQVEYTWENMRLGAIQGIVPDANGDVLVNWYTILGQSAPAEIDFDLDNASPASGAVRKLCTEVTRGIQRALGGLWMQGSSILALCGDAFWDDLTAHSEIRQTYLNTQQAQALRDPLAWETVQYGGITWMNYRGSDDGSTLAVDTNKCKFVPINVPGLFEVAFSPSESMPFVNTPGQPLYSMMILDDEREMWARPEVYSYPLFICTRPKALFRGKRT
jgi:hypothetical protein